MLLTFASRCLSQVVNKFQVSTTCRITLLILSDLLQGYFNKDQYSHYIQGVPKKTESNFKFRLFKDDLIV